MSGPTKRLKGLMPIRINASDQPRYQLYSASWDVTSSGLRDLS